MIRLLFDYTFYIYIFFFSFPISKCEQQLVRAKYKKRNISRKSSEVTYIYTVVREFCAIASESNE